MNSNQIDPRESEPSGASNRANRDALGETHNLPPEETGGRLGAASPSPAGGRNWVGRRIGRYEIRSLLGEGGMGVVYKAFDVLIERDVAIKVLPEGLSHNEVNLQRFLAEARAAGKLNHANTVAIYEVGKEGDVYYLVMEYLSGGTVSEILEAEGALSVADATRVTADACRGLAAAHAVGLVHRDIKPANLLTAQDGLVKVADFGLAKRFVDTTRQITQAGHIVGTPYFMSPEQCEAKTVDQRSDIYSLGATYYALLTGMNPYDSDGSVVQVMFAHCQAEIPDPRKINPAIPAACSQIIACAMAKRPEDRYQTAATMLADLEAVAASLSSPREAALPSRSGVFTAHSVPRMPGRYRKIVYWAVGLAAAAALGLILIFRDSGPPSLVTQDATITAATPLAVPVPTGRPIRVGVLHSLTGTMAESESPVVEATLLAIEELNRAGGVLGRPVEALVRDGRSDPRVFAAEAEKLLTEDRVCTVFGCWTSASRKTIVPIFEKHDHLLVYPVQYEGLEESPNVIYLGATPNQQIVPAVQWAFAFQGRRRFFLVGSDYVFPRAANAIIRDTLTKLGAETVGEEYLPLGSFDVQEVVDKILGARPEVILNTINGDSNVSFFKALRAAGVTPDRIGTISFSIGEEELRHLNVSEMAGDLAAWNYFQSIDSPENKRFVAGFRAKFGPQRLLTDPMEAAYVGVKLWAKAVEQARSDRVGEIRHAFAGQHILAPEGELRVDGATRHAFKTPRIGKITDDGQFEIIWKAVKPEPPVPFPPSRTPDEWRALLDEMYSEWGNAWSAPAR